MQRWLVGEVSITRIVEQRLDGTLDGLIPEATPAAVLAHEWLAPDHVLPSGSLRYSVHALGIQTPSLRIVVDTCVGNGRERVATPFWDHLDNPFLEQLEAAGFGRLQVDRVVCTHLHLDHVGWNTHRVGDRWQPTFPNARYLLGRAEYDRACTETEPSSLGSLLGSMKAAVFGDSIRPVVEAGLVDLVETDHQVCDEVSLVPTPGHTSGHVGVIIRSQGEEALITGDAVHHPCQLAHPDWWTLADEDRQMTIATRCALLARAAARGQLVIGSHWAGVSGGHVVCDGDAYRLA